MQGIGVHVGVQHDLGVQGGVQGGGHIEGGGGIEPPPHMGVHDAQVQGEHHLPPPPQLGVVGVQVGEVGIHEALQVLPGEVHAPPQEHVTLRHPRGFDVQIPRSALPSDLKGRSLEEVRVDLQAKVDRGGQLINDVLSGRVNPQERPCSDRDMTDIMWFLHTASEHKVGQPWQEGAVSVEDPGGQLRAFLDSSPSAYQRLSTHVTAFQGQPDGRARGMDVYGDATHMDTLLPYGRNTLLYQKMGTEGPQGMDKNMLLLKMEPHGCFSQREQLPESGPTRQENQHDRQAFWGHVKTTAKSIWLRITGQNTPEGSFKERISSGAQKAFKNLASWHMFSSTLPSSARQILNQNNPTGSAGGVRIMLQNINAAIIHLGTLPGDHSRDIAKLTEFKEKYITGNGQMDHLDLRIGSEVIFTQAELQGGIQQTPSHAVGELAKEITQPVQRERLEIGVTGQLREGVTSEDVSMAITGDGVCQQFVADFVTRPGQLSIGGTTVPYTPSEGHDQPGGERITQFRGFFTREGEFNEAQCGLVSKLVTQMTGGCLQTSLEAPDHGGPWDGSSGNLIVPRHGSEQTQVHMFRDAEGDIHIINTTTVDVQRITTGMFDNPPGENHDFEPGQSQMTRSVEIIIPRDSARPQDMRVGNVSYQVKTPTEG